MLILTQAVAARKPRRRGPVARRIRVGGGGGGGSSRAPERAQRAGRSGNARGGVGALGAELPEETVL